MITNIKPYLSRFVTKSPYVWNIAWKCINTFSFLLPHDNSYWALKHFSSVGKGLFLDVGANTGVSALSFRKINKNIPVLSIEPNSIHYDSLSKLEKKIPFFSFLIVGAGAKIDGVVTFYTPKYKRVILHTFTSTSKNQVFKAINESFGKKISSNIKIQKTVSKIIRIDDLGIAPTIIKIDSEGADFQVLLGAQETLSKMRPFFMIESCWCSFKKIEDFFKNNDYALLGYCYKKDQFYYLDQSTLSFASEEKNVFAVPLEKAPQLPFKCSTC